MNSIDIVKGSGVPVRGNDIDTDRIIPARFLKCVTFEGLGDNAFADDIAGLAAQGKVHPFRDPAYKNGSILVSNQNFGCGSSREHAPQALKRWGIRAIIAESYSEIFFGNCVAQTRFSPGSKHTRAKNSSRAPKAARSRWETKPSSSRLPTAPAASSSTVPGTHAPPSWPTPTRCRNSLLSSRTCSSSKMRKARVAPKLAWA